MLYIILLIILIYNISAIIKNKTIPESISATAYIFKPIIFTIYCFIVGISLFPMWILHTDESLHCLCFLSCSGILFAGTTPFYREEHQKLIHNISGIASVLFYILWLILSKYYIVLSVCVIFMMLAVIFSKKNYVFYIENIVLYQLIILLLYL